MVNKRKWMKWISLLIIIILLFIYFKDYHGYRYLNKEIVYDNIKADIKIKYKNINENLRFILKPISKYSCEVNMKIVIGNDVYETNTTEFGYDNPIVINDIYFIKNFENDDFENYVIFYDSNEDGKPSKYSTIIFYCFLKESRNGYFYRFWDDELYGILSQNGLDNYTQDEIVKLKEEVMTWDNVLEKIGN